MDEDELLRRYGLTPSESELDEIRELLARQAELGFDADTEVMKLCCVQLFNHGSPDDVLRIWQAKESGWDAHCSIDVQLLCGAGLAETKAFLAASSGELASQALEYIVACEAADDFEDFTVASRSAGYREYYTPLA
jgi:hypothetical protein